MLGATATALTATAALTQPSGAGGCVSETGSGACAAVARFIRNTATGAVAQPAGSSGCVGETGWPCADGHGLGGPSSVAVSPDGKSVYVASDGGNAVDRFNRNTTTGAITQPAG